MTTPAATLSVSQAARVMGVHEKTIRRAVARGELDSVRIGRRVLIPTHRVVRLLDGEVATP